MPEVVGSGLVALGVSAGIIRRRRYLNDLSVASRGELRARLPRFARWLIPRYVCSPRYVRAEAFFGEVLMVFVAIAMWLNFIGVLQDLVRRPPH